MLNNEKCETSVFKPYEMTVERDNKVTTASNSKYTIDNLLNLTSHKSTHCSSDSSTFNNM